jgi:hypothetical protein
MTQTTSFETSKLAHWIPTWSNLRIFFQHFIVLPQKSPLPSVGGDEGEGGQKGLYSVHPHPHPPPSKRGRGIGGEISNIFG